MRRVRLAILSASAATAVVVIYTLSATGNGVQVYSVDRQLKIRDAQYFSGTDFGYSYFTPHQKLKLMGIRFLRALGWEESFGCATPRRPLQWLFVARARHWCFLSVCMRKSSRVCSRSFQTQDERRRPESKHRAGENRQPTRPEPRAALGQQRASEKTQASCGSWTRVRKYISNAVSMKNGRAKKARA